MTSSRPYLIRALYEWITDNGQTPYVIIDATQDVSVPQEHVHEGRIVLNISIQAVHELNLGNDSLQFKARFSGVVKHIYAPITEIVAIYAKENGRGMVFTDEDLDDKVAGESGPLSDDELPKPPRHTKPNLKIVK